MARRIEPLFGPGNTAVAPRLWNKPSGRRRQMPGGPDAIWWGRIKRFEKDRLEKIRHRKRFLRQFTKGYWSDSDIDRIGHNLVFAWVQTILPQVLFKQPKARVVPRKKLLDGQQPKTMEDPVQRFARAMKDVLDFTYEVSGQQAENRMIVFRALLEGLAWSKDSWDLERRMRCHRFVPADDVYVDPAARHSLQDARYLIHRVVRPADEVFADPNLKIPKTYEPNWTFAQESRHSEYVRKDEDLWEEPLILYYEVWYKPPEKEYQLFVLYDEANGRGRDEAWPVRLDPHDWPFVPLMFNTDGECFDGFSSLQSVEEYYKGLSELATYIYRRSRKSCTDKLLMDSSLPADMKHRLSNSQDLAVVEVDGLSEMTGDPVRVIQTPSMNRDVLTAFNTMKMDSDQILGLSDAMRGGSGENFETATEAEMSRASSQTRLQYTIERVEEFLSLQTKHGAQLTYLLMFDPQRLEQILGTGWLNSWDFGLDADEIEYLFTIAIETGSTREINRQRAVMEATQLFNIGMRAMPTGLPNMQALWTNLLQAYDIKDPQEFTSALLTPEQMLGVSTQEQTGMPSAQTGPGGAALPMPEGNMALEQVSRETAGVSKGMQGAMANG